MGDPLWWLSMNWRESGRLFRGEYISKRKQFASIFQERISLSKPTFLNVLMRWAGRERNPDPIIEYLRSDAPITTYDREQLAKAIESIELRPHARPRGRPRNRELHELAAEANHLLRRGRTMNDQAGINDFGPRSEMMDEAIAMSIELSGNTNASAEEVRALLERPRSRRK